MSARRRFNPGLGLYTLPPGLPGAQPLDLVPVAAPVPVGGPTRNELARRSLGWSETASIVDPSARGLTRQVLDHTSDQFRVLALQANAGDVWPLRVTQYVDSATTVQTEYSVGEVGIALPIGAGRVTVDTRCAAIGSAARGGRLSAMVSFGAPLVYELPSFYFATMAPSVIAWPAFATAVRFTAPDGATATINPGLSTYTVQPGASLDLAALQGGTFTLTASVAFCLVSAIWKIRR